MCRRVSVRAGSEEMKADMEVEEGRRGGRPVVEVGGGQPFSGAIAILFSTSLSCGFGGSALRVLG